MDGPLSKPLTAANAEKILVDLFTTEPARDVRDTDYYRDQTTDGGDPLDPALRGFHGNKEKTANRPRDPGVIPSRDLKYPNGSLLLSPRGYHRTGTNAAAPRTLRAAQKRPSHVGLYLDITRRPIRHQMLANPVGHTAPIDIQDADQVLARLAWINHILRLVELRQLPWL